MLPLPPFSSSCVVPILFLGYLLTSLSRSVVIIPARLGLCREGRGDFLESGVQLGLPSGESPEPVESEQLPVVSLAPEPSADPEVFFSTQEADEIVVYALDPITSANTTGLKSVLLGVIGPYENIVTEYRYMNNNQSAYSYLREITPDYPWFGSLAVFLVLLFSVFRIGGNLLWKK